MLRMLILIGIIVMIVLSGCSAPDPATSPSPTSTITPRGTPQPSPGETGKPDIATPVPTESPRPGAGISESLGGIRLGDSADTVTGLLGSDYTETVEEDITGSVGEDMVLRKYDGKMTVFLGKESKKVISVIAHSSGYKTGQGIEVGDKAQEIFAKYQVYETAVGRQDNKELTGWYHTGDGQIIIFDFNRNNDIRTNFDIEPDAEVEEIILAYWAHFD